MQLTFEQLPQAVSQLYSKLEDIERLLLQKNSPAHQQSEALLTIAQAADLLRLSVPTVYGLVSRREIPSMKKGKRLYFSNQELTDWVKSGRKQTNTEIEGEADAYLGSLKQRRAAV